MRRFLMILSFSAVALAGCSPKPGAGEPGAKLLEERCLRCHPTGIKKASKTAAEWDQTLTTMISRGAALSDAERKTLVEFLIKYYQP